MSSVYLDELWPVMEEQIHMLMERVDALEKKMEKREGL